MEKYLVSYHAYGCNYNSIITIEATSESNAVAQIQSEGHFVHWACKVNL